MKGVIGGGRTRVVVDVINCGDGEQPFAKISWAYHFLFFKSAANAISQVGGNAHHSVVGY